MTPILHHYWGSNYAEKARKILALKGVAWSSVIIPDVMPKPDLVALTGGYSKTPVLQLGADVYCDTKRIADELEARYPEPTLFPGRRDGIVDVIQYWADGALTLAGGRYLIGRSHENWRPEFHADRAALWGVPVDLERMARSAERYRQRARVPARREAQPRRHHLSSHPVVPGYGRREGDRRAAGVPVNSRVAGAGDGDRIWKLRGHVRVRCARRCAEGGSGLETEGGRAQPGSLERR